MWRRQGKTAGLVFYGPSVNSREPAAPVPPNPKFANAARGNRGCEVRVQRALESWGCQCRFDSKVRFGANRGFKRTFKSRHQLLLFHGVDVVGARECAGAHVLGVARDRSLDARTDVTVTFDEFRHPWRKPEHVLQNENLPVAGDAR